MGRTSHCSYSSSFCCSCTSSCTSSCSSSSTLCCSNSCSPTTSKASTYNRWGSPTATSSSCVCPQTFSCRETRELPDNEHFKILLPEISVDPRHREERTRDPRHTSRLLHG